MKFISQSALHQISGGLSNENTQSLIQFGASYAGVAAISTPFFLFVGNTLSHALLFSFVITPALGIGGSMLGAAAYTYGPQLFNQLTSSTNNSTSS